MAPCFASLFIGKLEKLSLDNCENKPDVWFRFLDDIFLLWTHSLEELHVFINCLNEFHPSIKFTYDISDTKVTFLDVDVSINNENVLNTSVPVKPTIFINMLNIVHVNQKLV